MQRVARLRLQYLILVFMLQRRQNKTGLVILNAIY